MVLLIEMCHTEMDPERIERVKSQIWVNITTQRLNFR